MLSIIRKVFRQKDNPKVEEDPYSIHLLSASVTNARDFVIHPLAYNKVVSIGSGINESTVFLMRCIDESYHGNKVRTMNNINLVEWMTISDSFDVDHLNHWFVAVRKYLEYSEDKVDTPSTENTLKHIKSVTDLLYQILL